MYSTGLECLSKALRKQEFFPSALERMQPSQGGDHSSSCGSGQNHRRHYARARPYRPPLSSSYYYSPVASSCFSQFQPRAFRHPYHGHQAWNQPLRQPTNSFRHPYHGLSYGQQTGHQARNQPLHRPNSIRHSSYWNNPALRQCHDGKVPSRHRNMSPPSRPKVRVSDHHTNSDKVKYPLLSLVSYNLLAQDLIQKNMFLYRNDRMEYLEWDHRKKQLLREVLEMNADMYCFQEVQEDHYHTWYYPELKAKGYEGIFQKRTGHYSDGCALFYLSNKLQILEHKKLLFQKQTGTLIRDNVAIVAKFALSPFHYAASDSDQRFCIATTHLLFNHKAGEIKLAQICYLLAELYHMACDGGSILPSIICGDLNCLPNSPLLDFLLHSKLDYSKLDAWDICGYKNKPANYRQIPVPVVPSVLGIGQNCLYNQPYGKHSLSKSIEKIPVETTREVMSVPQTMTKSCSDVKTSIADSNMHTTKDDTTIRNNMHQTPAKQDSSGSSTGGTPSNRQASVSEHVCHRPIITHPFNLRSGYPIPRDTEHSPTVTTYHRSACETVDYIFFTPSSEDDCPAGRAGFHLVSRTALPSQHTLRLYGPQPNHVLSSDHLYLQVDLQLIN